VRLSAERSWERGAWEFDVGACLDIKRWGIALTMDFLGSNAPSGACLTLGPFACWLTVWHWTKVGAAPPEGPKA